MTLKIQRLCAVTCFTIGLAACSTGGIDRSQSGPFAPGVDPRGQAVDGVEVGHRLVASGEYELAIKSFNRAALENGMDAEILSGLGTANLGLGRLNQAERLLRRATTEHEAWPEIWNNLGVVLMEQGKTPEAMQIFRKAYALDSGQSTDIRDNLRLAIAKTENSDIGVEEDASYKLVRRGSADYLIDKGI
ncbi:MAG: tetratricopeptide repeat protein [Pseudomonadota bacterium]